MSNQPIIKVQDLVKAFPDFQLGPVSFQLEQGFVLAVVGPNGSGKTSMFQLFMSVGHPDEGEILFFGESLKDKEVEIKQRIGYVTDNSYSDEQAWYVAEFADFHSYWYPQWSKAKWEACMKRYEIDPRRKVKDLSKGMKRRVHFALALAQNPDLLLLDEPSSGLDPLAWRLMLEDIQQFMIDGSKNVILATHTIEEVKRLADYVTFMYEGRLLGFYEKDTLLDSWKSFAVDAEVSKLDSIPGISRVDTYRGCRIISHSAQETEQALRAQGIEIRQIQSVELDEILACLIKTNVNSHAQKGMSWK
ncbi:MAG: transporter ATP-binding protein [Paenibacillus sp.]|nr:transporter ATP-binding protein [Paenibacillus sp.]